MTSGLQYVPKTYDMSKFKKKRKLVIERSLKQ